MNSPRILVAGAASLLGEALLEALAALQLPADRVIALADGPDAGRSLLLGGSHLELQEPDVADIAEGDLLLVCSHAAAFDEPRRQALMAGAGVVLSGPSPLDSLVDPQDASAEQVLLPLEARMLAPLLDALPEEVGLRAVDVIVLAAAASDDREGLEALAGETAELLNGRDLGGQRTARAFNLIPSTRSVFELTAWLRDRFDSSVRLGVSSVTVPIFHGHSLMVHLHLDESVDPERIRLRAARAGGVHLCDCPTPRHEVTNREGLHMGALSAFPSPDRGLSCWLSTDAVKFTASALAALAGDWFRRQAHRR